ncbi:hypothetical protein BN1221_01163c [Brenneria goodwinii]|uniref:Uncharacterized protein n=1 Tax=Brenneria goodwinii TaxID=1109412 RepID=A0A0G4JS45_9GAMM|nr:hypothetical protein BN1221_01163c [Brenneria goodwinii]
MAYRYPVKSLTKPSKPVIPAQAGISQWLFTVSAGDSRLLLRE